MLKRAIFLAMMIGAVAVWYQGCTSSLKITHRSQLAAPDKTGPVFVLTKDSTLYQLNNYQLTDSLLIGTGLVKKDSNYQLFRGELKLSEIAYIQASSTSYWKSLLASGVIGFFGYTAASYLRGEEGLQVAEKTGFYSPGGGGEGSCPFVYSWDGDRYLLDAEIFGTALGRALEINTCSVLPSLREEHSLLKISIANERPETHYLNAIQLLAAAVDSGVEVVVAPDQTLWPVYRPVAPVRAVDQLGNDILPEVARLDQRYWESEISAISNPINFEDVMDLSFLRPSASREGSIVIRAVNTNLSNVVFKNIFEFLGDQSLAFMRAVESDSNLINSLISWSQESSLKVFLCENGRLSKISTIRPTATVAPFSRLIRFSPSDDGDDTLKIRLTCLADVWKIDAVQIDWTLVQPLKPTPVRLISAIGPESQDLTATLAVADDHYITLLPPEAIHLTFQAMTPMAGQKMVYALNAQGYLYEWPPATTSHSTTWSQTIIPENKRIDFLIDLLQHKSFFLPAIYAEWRRTKVRE